MSRLIQEVAAQSEPTFDYDGPFDPEPPDPQPDGKVDIKFSSTQSAAEVGELIKCSIELESNQETVSSYDLIIKFDASVLEVVDSDTTKAGIQIRNIDSFSTNTSNTSSNTTGEISFASDIPGSAQTINRKVAEITFRAKATGTSIVNIDKANTLIIGESGENLLGSTTTLNFSVSGQTSDQPPTDELPSSGIFDNLGSIGTIFSGVLLLFVGTKAIINSTKDNDKHS